MPAPLIALRLLRPLLAVVRVLWAAPITIFGLFIALPVRACGGHWRRLRGGSTAAMLVHGRLADWLLERHPAGRMNAMAIGHIVVAARTGLGPLTLAHELEHVRQAERWGPLFPILYAGSSAWQWLNGRNAYWHNHFEVAARAAADRAA
ncbi:MAG TPA: hypothetical protein VM406_08190, partial [Noviherbaspirillum sp.]|nr:hypothetical protein [Noviherbaspirillum sp.]